MPNDFDDAIRRAAGLPTEAELQEKRAEQARAQQALMEDMPRRNAAIQTFRAKVYPLIRSTFEQVQRNIADAPFTMQELQIAGYFETLEQRMFTVSRKSKIAAAGPTIIPMLNFSLSIEEKVLITASAATPLPGFTPVESQLLEFDAEKFVPKAFIEYVTLVRPIILGR